MTGRVLGEWAEALTGAGAAADALRSLEDDILRDVADLPRDTPWRDAHTHLGRDRDGHSLAPEALIADLDRAGVADCISFPANDPGPDGQFLAANAAVIAAARRHPGRITPFCRVDPRSPGALASLERAVSGGAAGLKLHPVAQSFAPESPECVTVVEAATERGLPVLVHAGFGARRLAEPIARLVAAVPSARLILAHAGRGDAAALAGAVAGNPRIVFDTSLATLPDVLMLGPDRLVFGSDRPYGEHATALQLVGLAARAGGWTPAQAAAVLGGNLTRLLQS